MATAVTDNTEEHRFEIRVDGDLAGFAVYRARPTLIAFVHTEIDDRFEGQGLGSKLVSAALDSARDRGLAVLPFCPFVNGFIKKHPEYLDLVPEDRREAFDL
jgi:predicted GNAT family acetyltransferase